VVFKFRKIEKAVRYKSVAALCQFVFIELDQLCPSISSSHGSPDQTDTY